MPSIHATASVNVIMATNGQQQCRSWRIGSYHGLYIYCIFWWKTVCKNV